MRGRTGLRAVLVVGLAMIASACGPTPPSRAQEGETCLGAPLSCGDKRVESCCSSGGAQCAYRISDGTDFPCNGNDCGQAANDAAAYCRG